MKTKICTKCNIEKEIKEFSKKKENKDGLDYWCKDCKKEYDKKRYLKNKSEILKQHKIYDNLHKKEKKERHQAYYLKNKDKIKEHYLKYINIKRKEDKKFKLKTQLRNMIRFSFYRKGKTKSKKTEEIVGISLDNLYKYLLKTFENNYGHEYNNEDVEIDHIIPLSTANTEDDIIKLCNYKNLQLLKKEDNRIKSNKLNWELK